MEVQAGKNFGANLHLIDNLAAFEVGESMSLEGESREDVYGLEKVWEFGEKDEVRKSSCGPFALPAALFRGLKLLAAAIILLSEFCMETEPVLVCHSVTGIVQLAEFGPTVQHERKFLAIRLGSGCLGRIMSFPSRHPLERFRMRRVLGCV